MSFSLGEGAAFKLPVRIACSGENRVLKNVMTHETDGLRRIGLTSGGVCRDTGPVPDSTANSGEVSRFNTDDEDTRLH